MNRNSYKRLDDAVKKTRDERFGNGSVGIWYARASVSRDLYDGLACAQERGYSITRQTITTTHVHLGNIEADDAEMAFALMTGDYWNPNGEANAWLVSLGLDHTSMMVGDVIDFRGKLLFVEFEGFADLDGG